MLSDEGMSRQIAGTGVTLRERAQPAGARASIVHAHPSAQHLRLLPPTIAQSRRRVRSVQARAARRGMAVRKRCAQHDRFAPRLPSMPEVA